MGQDTRVEKQGFSVRIKHALAYAGITDLKQIESKEQLLKMDYIGKDSTEEIIQKMNSHGLKVKGQDCEYCEEVDSKVVTGKRAHIFCNSYDATMKIKEGSERKIEVKMGEATLLTKKIKYCFMCGRKL